MSAPEKWFDYKNYFNSKLALLHEQGYNDFNDLTLQTAFQNAGYPVTEQGMWDHYEAYGAAENVSPSPYFDANYYFQSKAAQYYYGDAKYASQVTDQQVIFVKNAFAKNGYSAWEHYTKFGMKEGIDPNANFNTNAYLEAKVKQLAELGIVTDRDAVVKSFMENNLNPIQHYALYGDDEGLKIEAATHGATTQELTPKVDHLVGTTGDPHVDDVTGDLTVDMNMNDNFTAEVGTLQSADTIDGLGGFDTFYARVDATGKAGELEPTISNVEQVLFRSEIGDGGQANNAAPVSAYIDADRINLYKTVVNEETGKSDTVEDNTSRMWIGSDNSRADLAIEDVRHNSNVTTVRFADADPEVDFKVYFDPQHLKAQDAETTGSLQLKMMDVKNAQLSAGKTVLNDWSWDILSFRHNGVLMEMQFLPEDDARWHGSNATYESLLIAFQNALKVTEKAYGLAEGTLTADFGPDFIGTAGTGPYWQWDEGRSIVITDNAGVISCGDDVIGTGWSASDPNQVKPSGGIAWGYDDDLVGTCPLIQVTVEVDNLGRVQWGDANPQCLPDDMIKGSEAGFLQIGSMSMRSGIERMDVIVDRGSWLSGLYSTNDTLRMVTVTAGDINGNGWAGNEKATSNQADGTPGQLFIGTWEGKLDLEGNGETNLTWADRAKLLTASKADNTGLNDVSVFDASGYEGDINIAANITDASYDKYLKHVDGSWEINDHFAPLAGEKYAGAFTYMTGSGEDTINMNVAGDIASDVDFKMNIVTQDSNDLVAFRFNDLSDNQSFNQKYMKNVKVDTGNGDDTVWFYADEPTEGAGSSNGIGVLSFSLLDQATGMLTTYVRYEETDETTGEVTVSYVSDLDNPEDTAYDFDADDAYTLQQIYDDPNQFNAVIGEITVPGESEASYDGALVIETGAGKDRIYANQVDYMEGGMLGGEVAPTDYNAVYVFNYAAATPYGIEDEATRVIAVEGFDGATLNNDVASGIDRFTLSLDAQKSADYLEARVTFRGISQTAKVELDADDTSDGFVTAEVLNHAIIEAINGKADSVNYHNTSVLDGLLSAKDGAGHSLLIESKVNGQLVEEDLTITFTAYTNQGTKKLDGDVFDDDNVTPAYTANFAVDKDYNYFTGEDDLTHNQVVVDAGTGDDLIVLGQNYAIVDGDVLEEQGDIVEGATDVVKLTGLFGNDTIVDFDTTADKINVNGLFSSYPVTVTALESDDQKSLSDNSACAFVGGKNSGTYSASEIQKLVGFEAGSTAGDEAVVLVGNNAAAMTYTVALVTKTSSDINVDVKGTLRFAADDVTAKVPLTGVNIDDGSCDLVDDPVMVLA